MNTMKNLGRHLTRASLFAAVAGLTLLTSNAVAQEKGAERLMKLERLNTPADVQKVEAGDTLVMSCPKCKDTWATVVEPTGKAVNPHDTKIVQRHECPGCKTQIVTQGAGKQVHSKVVHTCKQCGSQDASCCVLKRTSSTTKGMEEQKGHQH